MIKLGFNLFCHLRKNKPLFLLLFFNLVYFFYIYATHWEELKGEHFIVYYYPDYKTFAKEVLSCAEDYYKSIAENLGYPRYSNFWLWEKRVKIYIYPDHRSFLEASKQPAWSHGVADYKNKTIISYFKGKGFLNSILPHEIAHLIFRDFVGFKGEIPLWLDEGVAQWSEEVKREKIKRFIKDAFYKKILIPFREMMGLDVREVKKDDTVYIPSYDFKKRPKLLALKGKTLLNLYYAQSASLIGFLIEKYGINNFATFCRNLRDGKSVDEAIRSAYPYFFKNLEDLEKRWYEEIKSNY
jgi:hypothetical protein